MPLRLAVLRVRAAASIRGHITARLRADAGTLPRDSRGRPRNRSKCRRPGAKPPPRPFKQCLSQLLHGESPAQIKPTSGYHGVDAVPPPLYARHRHSYAKLSSGRHLHHSSH